jgi:hypothetical protein
MPEIGTVSGKFSWGSTEIGYTVAPGWSIPIPNLVAFRLSLDIVLEPVIDFIPLFGLE